MTERLEALKKSQGDDGDCCEFWGNDEPKCPHCGANCPVSENEWYELYEEGEHEVTCPDCDMDFIVSTNVSFSFTTQDQPE